MNYEACESFIQFCDDMMIANETDTAPMISEVDRVAKAFIKFIGPRLRKAFPGKKIWLTADKAEDDPYFKFVESMIYPTNSSSRIIEEMLERDDTIIEHRLGDVIKDFYAESPQYKGAVSVEYEPDEELVYHVRINYKDEK